MAEASDRLKGEPGYYCLSMAGVGFTQLHRIVATAFHGPPPSAAHQCHHIDGTRENNEAANLMWVTQQEHSQIHAAMER